MKTNNYKHEGLVEQQIDNEGYMTVNLVNNKGEEETRRVHELVWEAFKGKIPEGYEVSHINGDKTDNRLENLKLVKK